MTYRSLKRVLGETNLERKCRLLFAFFLGLLIAGAFLFVEYNAENMILQTTRRKARDLVDISLLKYHFHWYTEPERKGQVEEMTEGLDNQNYEYQILAYEDWRDRRRPEDPWELETLHFLEQEMKEQIADQSKNKPERNGGIEEGGEAGGALARLADPSRNPIFRERLLPQEGQYHYYQPIYWKKSCLRCHPLLQDVGVVPAAEAGDFYDDGPFWVIKVVIPYQEMQDAINSARAVLIATFILTVFLAMVLLYGIVRYVIVKPLKHLRDVSDDISRGNTELRAEINTNDEFEELAESFNRMLRHLTDTQGELQQVNADLDAKVDQLAQLNMRLYEMNRLKNDFLANMSHELRTPLNSIIGFSEVLQGIDSLSDKQKRYARNIQKSGRVLLEMINDILDLAKMEAGKMEVRPSQFRIDSVVQAQCDMVRSLSEEKNIDLEVHVAADNPPLYQDQAKVQQVLTNLLSNAIKFTPEGGRITVSAQPDPHDRLVLTVADTGVGIAEEDHEIIFEKFRQSTAVLGKDGLTREYSGTGLGLSIVKELCKLLGGEITFESQLGKGSTFKVVVPWTRTGRSDQQSRVTSQLNELTRPSREDFQHAQAVTIVRTPME